MAANPTIRPEAGSFLLELLYHAGWRLQVRDGEMTRIHAARDGVEVDAAGASLADAAGVAFARAMRSRRKTDSEGQ